MEERIYAFAADNNFVVPLAVSLTSLARNCQAPIRVVVATTDISETTRQRVATLFSGHAQPGSTLDWLEINGRHLAGFPLGFKHLSPLAYARLFLPRLLPPAVLELIYLDCDIVVTGDVSGWLTSDPTRENIVAAVQDFNAPNWGSPAGLPYLCSKAVSSQQLPIFNSGILRINVPAWLDFETEGKCRAFIAEHANNIKGDQDALNYVFRGRWQPLHPRWNLQGMLAGKTDLVPECLEAIRRVDEKKDAIIHFCTRHKPWNSGLKPNPRITIWLEALRDSGWFSPAEYHFWRAKRLGRLLWRSAVRRF